MKAISWLARLNLVGMALGVLLLASLSASCSGTPTVPATSLTSPTATKPYGSLTVATKFGQDNLDPTLTGPQTFEYLGGAIFDSLVELAPDGVGLVPRIAERWEIAADGKTHIFYIRKGVKFHDGSDLTGADVKFSIERMLAPEATVGYVTEWRPVVASVELKDDYTVALHLKKPVFELLTRIEYGVGAVMPKKYIEANGADYFGKHLIGSGPWKFVSYEWGNRLRLEANENYWKSDEVPKFKDLTILSVAEEVTRLAMLRTGELDMAKIAIDSAAALKAAGLRVVKGTDEDRYFGYFFWDVAYPERYAFGDKRVRKALLLAMNRQEIVDKLFGGYGRSTAAVGYVPEKDDSFDPNVFKLDLYDPEGAKRLLAEAGYPNGFATKIWNYGGGGTPHDQMNQAIAGYWQRIGVKADVVAIDYSAFIGQMSKPVMFGSFWTHLSVAKRGWQSILPATATSGSTTATRKIDDPRLDELMLKAPVTPDPAERRKLTTEIVQIVKDNYAGPGLVDVSSLWGVSPKIGELSASGRTAWMFKMVTHAK